MREDPESGELVGAESEVQALLESRRADYRIWTEGEAPRAEVLGGEPCVLVTDRPGDERALAEIPAEVVPVALAGWLRLGPRPLPREPALRLPPGARAGRTAT